MLDLHKETILVTAVSGDIGCSAVRSLSEEGYKIIGCDMKLYTPVLHMLQKYYQSPPANDTESYISFIKGVIEKENVDFFLPVSEPEIEVLNEQRSHFKNMGIRLLLNNKTIIDNCLDKLRTIQYLEKLGISVPRTTLLSNYDNSFGYPLIIKGRKGCGGKKLWIAENHDDLDYIRRRDDGSLLVQEYIGSDAEDYTTGIFSDGKIASSISFRRKLGFGGLSVEAVIADESFLEHLSQTISDKMGLIGSINLQSRRVGDKFVPYEINPRLSSTLLFRKQFGFDDAVWWVNVLQGKGYSFVKKYKSGRAIRCLSECYFDMVEVSSNEND